MLDPFQCTGSRQSCYRMVVLFVALVIASQVRAQVGLPLPPRPLPPAPIPVPSTGEIPAALFDSSDFSFLTSSSFRDTPASRAQPSSSVVQASGYQPPEEYNDPNYQSAPGGESEFVPPTRAYRTYQYFSRFYDQPGIGPRPYADYAPRGYYPLDYQEAPGAPLYERIPVPEQVTPEQLEESVVRGPLNDSFVVPSTGTSLRLSGFVRMGANFSFDPIGTPDLFVTRTIPVPNSPGQDMNFSARPTRLSLDSWTPVPELDSTIHTFIQMDFLSGNPPGVGSSSNPRLRFAYFDVGYFRVGQDTTVFMDPSSFPRTADFQGPNGIVNARQGLVRMTLPIGERFYWASAAEQPFSDISTFGLGDNVQEVPDFTTHLRYEADLFHLQAAAILRTIGYRPTGGTVERDAGYGMNLTGNFHPWAVLMGTDPIRDPCPDGLTRSRVLLQYGVGYGIARYFQDTTGQGFDGAVTASGAFETLFANGWTTAYEHWFNDHWMVNLTYSKLRVGNTDLMPGSTYQNSQYVANSLWWIPVTNLSIGIEYLWGQRGDLDDERGRAQRIQTAFQYNF